MYHLNTTFETVTEASTVVKNQKLWNVIIHDSDFHTFDYVVDLLVTVFRKTMDEAAELTKRVHLENFAIAETVSKERAELYLEQVNEFKPSPKLHGCNIKYAINATMEEA